MSHQCLHFCLPFQFHPCSSDVLTDLLPSSLFSRIRPPSHRNLPFHSPLHSFFTLSCPLIPHTPAPTNLYSRLKSLNRGDHLKIINTSVSVGNRVSSLRSEVRPPVFRISLLLLYFHGPRPSHGLLESSHTPSPSLTSPSFHLTSTSLTHSLTLLSDLSSNPHLNHIRIRFFLTPHHPAHPLI